MADNRKSSLFAVDEAGKPSLNDVKEGIQCGKGCVLTHVMSR